MPNRSEQRVQRWAEGHPDAERDVARRFDAAIPDRWLELSGVKFDESAPSSVVVEEDPRRTDSLYGTANDNARQPLASGIIIDETVER
ncbi:MAG TPA: hypothetical protein VGF75_05600 [Candidatus Saccharimonadales bacterium]|jgi:hypothetical protein